MVDGTTLELLPPIFYEANNSIRFFRNGKINIPHYPIIGLEDKFVTKAVKYIERKIYKNEDKYGLEESAHDFKLIGVDERYIEDIWFFSNFSTKPQFLYEGAIFLRKFNIKN